MAFYDPDGLKAIALLLDDLVTTRKVYSQNHLSELIGVAPNTIKGLRSNRHAFQYKPDPDILLSLAPYLVNPLTNQPFSEDELLELVRGRLKVPLPGESSESDDEGSSDSELPLPSFLRQQMQERRLDEAAFARATKLKADEIQAILRGENPNWMQLLKLGSYLFPDKSPAPLLRLLNIDPAQPIEYREHATNGH